MAKQPVPNLRKPRSEVKAELEGLISDGRDIVERYAAAGSTDQDLELAISEMGDWTGFVSLTLRQRFDNETFSDEFMLVGRQETIRFASVFDPDPTAQERAAEAADSFRKRFKYLIQLVPRLQLIEEGPDVSDPGPASRTLGDRIFVVHGRDNEWLQSIARWIEKTAPENPVTVLQERPSKGKTVIEKLEAEADEACFFVLIYTADDEGRLRTSEDDDEPPPLQPRARQNVILETGFAIGKLGRDRTVILYAEGIEPPSDINGVVYIPLDSAEGWQLKLAKELNAAGLRVEPL